MFVLTADQFLSRFDKYIKIVDSDLASGYDKVKDKIFFQTMQKPDILYYRTIFHELVHWTGHHTRLDRDYIYPTEQEREIGYVREEVIAEIGSSHLLNKFEMYHPWYDSVEYLKPYIEHIMQYIDTSIAKEWEFAQIDVHNALDFLYDFALEDGK